jgi:hypothetical protein
LANSGSSPSSIFHWPSHHRLAANKHSELANVVSASWCACDASKFGVLRLLKFLKA